MRNNFKFRKAEDTLLPSQKNTLTYIEFCRVSVSDMHLSYSQAAKGVTKFFTIPYANINILLLGPGTSITHEAATYCSANSILLAFVGGGIGTFYFASQNEYRPTEYMQKWYEIYADPAKSLKVAKKFQVLRAEMVNNYYEYLYKFNNIEKLHAITNSYCENIRNAKKEDMHLLEAGYTKKIYGFLAESYGYKKFTREQSGADKVNSNIDQGNYMIYAISACTLWILGIQFCFPVSHGYTRRGGLVFDVADIVKDSISIPISFMSARKYDEDHIFRKNITDLVEDKKIISYLIEIIKETIDEYSGCQRE